MCQKAEQHHPVKCRHCGNTNVVRRYGERKVYCPQCNELEKALEAKEKATLDEGALTSAEKQFWSEEDILTGREKEIYEHLSSEPINVEVLFEKSKTSIGALSATLTMLELTGKAERLVGDRYVAIKARRIRQLSYIGHGSDHSATDNDVIGAIDFVLTHFQGVSRKYLQDFLAAHWLNNDRVRWSPGALLNACFQLGPIRNSDIVRYVTPEFVQLTI